MTERIAAGLYRIPVPLPGNPLRELNSYLFTGGGRSLLIDTGFRQEACRQALFAGLAELGVDRREVDVALTHLHSDHAGLAPEAAGDTGVIYVSGPDRAFLEGADEGYWARSDAFFRAEGFPPGLYSPPARVNAAASCCRSRKRRSAAATERAYSHLLMRAPGPRKFIEPLRSSRM